LKRPRKFTLSDARRKSKRPRRGPRQSTIKVYQIHCKACEKRYELAYTGEVKFCIYCASEKIEKSIRTRAETNAERAARKAEFNLHFLNMVGSVLNGLFGTFAPHPGFVAPHNGHGKPSSALEAELLKEGYRKLATKYHPDKGGDPEKMKELNRLKERLGL
jgi:hypothetical protein